MPIKSNAAIVKQWKQHLTETQRGLGSQYTNTRKTQAFYAGDMMAYRDTMQYVDPYGQKKKAVVQFNKIKPYVNAVKGFMAQNRREAKYIAHLDNSPVQELYSRYANALKNYIREQANADQKETQMNGDMLINGYGAMETDMTYGIGSSTTDPNGQIVMGRLDPLQVGWDPYAREPNLMDARWVFYQRDYALSDAMELFSDSDENDFETSTDHDLGEDSNYQWYAAGGRYNKIREANIDWSDQKKDMVKVFFYQWYEFEDFYRADNPILTFQNPESKLRALAEMEMIAQGIPEEDRDLFAFNPKDEILNCDEDVKKQLVDVFGNFIKFHVYKRKIFYKAIVSGQHIFTKFRSPCQQGFTTKFKTGDYDSKNRIWIGMVNSMMEPAMYYNKALTELMFIIGANSKGGVLVEKSAVDDIQKFEGRYAKTDSVIVVNDGALQKGQIKDKKSPQVTTGYEEIIQLSDASISDVNGIDKTFLGSSERKQETGLLQSRRIKQVVSSLACFFDADTLYQKDWARMLLDFLRIYVENNSGGLFRIIGEDGRDQFLKISEDKLVAQYDVMIAEAPQSPEEKQEFATLISAAADKLLTVDPTGAKKLYAIALKYLPLDRSDQQQIIQILAPTQPEIDPAMVQQLQQQVQELMSDMNQASVKEKLSKFALNLARIGEVQARTTELGSAAIKNKATAFHQVHEALLDEFVAKRDPHPQLVE